MFKINSAPLINNTYDDRLLMNCLMKRRCVLWGGAGTGFRWRTTVLGVFLDLKTETAHTHIPRCKNANVSGISETAVIFLALHIR